MNFLSPMKEMFGGQKEAAAAAAAPPPSMPRDGSTASVEGGSTPSRAAAASMSNKEMNDLAEIMLDSERLCQLAKDGLEKGNLTDDTASLERLADLSSRLLCRNRAREAAVKLGTALRVTQHTTSTLDAAAATLWPAYFRHSKENDETGEDIYLSKLYLHALPPKADRPEGEASTSLCVRFSLSSRGDEGMYDLSLKVLQVHPTEPHKHSFHFAFELQDRPANDAAEWVLDEVQRHKLVELQSLLGLTESLWTPVGVLGFVLAAASCAQLDELDFFKDLIRSVRESHRDEVLS